VECDVNTSASRASRGSFIKQLTKVEVHGADRATDAFFGAPLQTPLGRVLPPDSNVLSYPASYPKERFPWRDTANIIIKKQFVNSRVAKVISWVGCKVVQTCKKVYHCGYSKNENVIPAYMRKCGERMASSFVGFGGSNKIYLICLYSNFDQPKHSKSNSSVFNPLPVHADCLILSACNFSYTIFIPAFHSCSILYSK
jgi:hypothetical protein